jgi:hypothetical protein
LEQRLIAEETLHNTRTMLYNVDLVFIELSLFVYAYQKTGAYFVMAQSVGPSAEGQGRIIKCRL